MKKKLTFFIASIAILLLQSCMPIVKLVIGFKNPKVISIKDAEDYINKTQLYEGETFYLNVTKEKVFKDTCIFSEYKDNIMFSFNAVFFLFDSLGQRLLYQSDASCGGTRLQQCYDSLEYFFIKPDNAFTTINSLNELCNRLQNSKAKKVSIDQLPKSDYYIVQTWSMFRQNKKRMKEDFQWYKTMQDSSKYNFHIININTDLQENWGLKKGAKFKLNKTNNFGDFIDERWKENTVIKKMISEQTSN